MSNYEEPIEQWRANILASQKFQTEVIDELEDHLRTELDDLSELAIPEDETFMLAQRRMGNLAAIENEFSKLHRHTRWLQQLIIMLGGYILLTLLFQFIQVIAVIFGSAHAFTRISYGLGVQIYSISSMVLLALSAYGLWKLSQKSSPMRLLGYQSTQDGSLRKVVQNTVGITLIVIAAKALDGMGATLLTGREELFRGPTDSALAVLSSFLYGKSIFDGSTLPILMTLIFVVLMMLIRQETHQSAITS